MTITRERHLAYKEARRREYEASLLLRKINYLYIDCRYDDSGRICCEDPIYIEAMEKMMELGYIPNLNCEAKLFEAFNVSNKFWY